MFEHNVFINPPDVKQRVRKHDLAVFNKRMEKRALRNSKHARRACRTMMTRIHMGIAREDLFAHDTGVVEKIQSAAKILWLNIKAIFQ
jgi:hypothetical protein